MQGHSTYVPKTGFTRWLESRLPIISTMHGQFVSFPVPKNLNYFWTFGAMLMIFLVLQIVTGIVLVMHYVPHSDYAFNSVENIMRDVNYGWLMRYMHANGASFFFVAVFLHIFRGMYYGSYKAPREVLWILGVVIFLLMMATAFMGYVLPWGQMSFWGAQVITSLFGAIPVIGEPVKIWLWGGYAVDNPTLQRFFSLHYLMPFMIAGVVFLHVWALHVVGQNNPTGVEVKDIRKDTVPFTPYATVKDAFAVVCFFVVFSYFVFFHPNYLGHADNYIPADSLKTPAHIVPEWYFLPFYGILRSITFNIGPIDAKFAGVLAMFGSIAILAFLPWIDTSKVRSMNYRPVARIFFFTFVVVAVLLGYVGSQPTDKIVLAIGGRTVLDMTGFGLILTLMYFGYFVALFFLGLFEKPLKLPASISASVLERLPAVPSVMQGAGVPAGAHASPEKKG